MKNMEKKEQNIQELWNNYKMCKITFGMIIPERAERKKSRKKESEEIFEIILLRISPS